MRSYVDEIVSKLFENARDTQDMRALREEITENCREHFDDLISRGLSPEEAAREIEDSLNGMEELIKELESAGEALPAKMSTGIKEAEADNEITGEALGVAFRDESERTEDNSGAKRDFEPEGIRLVEVKTLSASVHFEPSEDGMIHLKLLPEEDDFELTSERQGDTLRVSLEKQRVSVHARGIFGASITEMIKTMLNPLSEGELYVYLPEHAPQVHAEAKSGDISLNGICPEAMELASTSGDLSARPSGGTESCKLSSISGDISFKGGAVSFSACSTSGDIELNGDFESCHVETRSGDINALAHALEASVMSTSGDISLKGRIRKLEIRSVSGDMSANVLCESCDAATTSGDIELALSDADRLRQVSVRTISGDAKLALPEGINASISFSTTCGDTSNRHPQGTIGNATVKLQSVSGDLTVI